MINSLVVYGYHEYEEFAKEVGRRIESINLPRTVVRRFKGRREPREVVLKDFAKEYNPIFMIDLHDTPIYHPLIFSPIELYYSFHDSFTGEMLRYIFQNEKFEIDPRVNFLLPFHYIAVEFFPDACSLNYSVKVVRKLIESINEMYKF